MDRDLVAIQIEIAGRAYPLKVDVREKDEVLEIVENLNNRLKTFQAQFPRQEKVDYLSMALLTYATDLHRSDSRLPVMSEPEVVPIQPQNTVPDTTLPTLSEEILEKLSDLETLLDKLIA